ncbi:MAG: Na/Pi symporter, partial [Pseudomonadota bacterium]
IVLVGARGKLAEYGRIVAALGFLLAGLALMKDSVSGLTDTYDISRLAGLSAWQFLLFGIVAAAVVQSSSAVMMLTLTALHADVVGLPDAAAVAIGADLGTTSTIIIGSLKGAAGKKRVALAHVIFNVTTDAIAFVFLAPLLALVALTGITDPLISLVVFHSLFNLIGIVLFLPFLKPFAALLSRRFNVRTAQESRFIGETSPAVTVAALQAIRNDTALIIGRVVLHNLTMFSPPAPDQADKLVASGWLPPDNSELRSRPPESMYRHNKKLEGEILGFALRVQEHALDENQTRQLNRMLLVVREAVHAAKSVRDIQHNLDDFSQSTNEKLNEFYEHFRESVSETREVLIRLKSKPDTRPVIRDFVDFNESIHTKHDRLHRYIYTAIDEAHVDDTEVSSLLNVNREIRNSSLALNRALQAFLLEESEIETLNEI